MTRTRSERTNPRLLFTEPNNTKERQVDVVIYHLPVGNEMATKWHAEHILDARCAMVCCIPVLIDREDCWRNRSTESGVLIVGDDIKSQLGATILH